MIPMTISSSTSVNAVRLPDLFDVSAMVRLFGYPPDRGRVYQNRVSPQICLDVRKYPEVTLLKPYTPCDGTVERKPKVG